MEREKKQWPEYPWHCFFQRLLEPPSFTGHVSLLVPAMVQGVAVLANGQATGDAADVDLLAPVDLAVALLPRRPEVLVNVDLGVDIRRRPVVDAGASLAEEGSASGAADPGRALLAPSASDVVDIGREAPLLLVVCHNNRVDRGRLLTPLFPALGAAAPYGEERGKNRGCEVRFLGGGARGGGEGGEGRGRRGRRKGREGAEEQ
jgi:hypothetical protein